MRLHSKLGAVGKKGHAMILAEECLCSIPSGSFSCICGISSGSFSSFSITNSAALNLYFICSLV